ncbi:hypothetical protein [Flavobacterium sp. DG2-3]|uniref:hypothetical protein n=1 Tax=Flavobacterium sp. DG2-3 TaxID=3068317 RepID=UPI00273FEC2B|nr:hypothetical protein [Flavobacterium sp. DG2-3]MDP5200080.1 hypothetical protein [Flavobacterium sp. DG2-3]
MESTNNIGFTPIELNIYEKLNWDYDLIVICLECIRREIPVILNVDSDDIEVFLISFNNFLEQSYPAIGIRGKSDMIGNVFDIEEKIENWIIDLGGIENLKLKTANLECPDWKLLQNIKKYP